MTRVHNDVTDRDDGCRIERVLATFHFVYGLHHPAHPEAPIDLAHLRARGMGGNPDLSRDTTKNTILARHGLHVGSRSLHSGHLKIRALTDKGADGPVCIEFYERLPTEVTK